VQGEESTADMVEALDLVNRELNVDVIILTRGGGSLEDLWAFNREELALAIRNSHIPVVSAVGHEIDFTITDLAADFRAPTPSAAAELLVVEKETLLNRLNDIRNRLVSGIGRNLKGLNQGLDRLSKRFKDPRKRLADTWMRLDEIHTRLARVMDLIVRDRQFRLSMEKRSLLLHSPLNVMVSIKQRLDFQRNSLGYAMDSCLGGKQASLSLLEKRIKDLGPLSILKRECRVEKLESD
ncbi:MAG: exodeoxyribonuclease VII large subunit, partial [Desulfobacteraceae bacterium 4484_190.2]